MSYGQAFSPCKWQAMYLVPLLKIEVYFLKRALQCLKTPRHHCSKSPKGGWHKVQELYKSTIDILNTGLVPLKLESQVIEVMFVFLFHIWRWAAPSTTVSTQKVLRDVFIYFSKKLYLVQWVVIHCFPTEPICP